MRIKALLCGVLALLFIAPSTALAEEQLPPRIAIAYDIGFLGDNSFNDAVHQVIVIAKKKFKIEEPNIREIPTSGTALDRITRLRFLAKSGYSLVIAVGSSYRDSVKRVAMEYPLTQFAIINDRSLAQLNISNIAFEERDGAYLAGVLAASETKAKKVGIVAAPSDLIKAFTNGAASVSKKVSVISLDFTGDSKSLRSQLQGVDIVYSLWDKDSSVLAVVDSFKGKLKYVARTPDQYFFYEKARPSYVIASIKKDLTRPVMELVDLGLQNRSIIDVLDEVEGIYGRSYGVKNKGIGISIYSKVTTTTKSRIALAVKKLSK